ncbi:MAG: aminopeptidase P N-terminal domain-containing protein [Pyrinomonadaceae bacterium]|nr:aminopeptidase P N-terminal domain-containing protein [Pyrinomonadaceae bacterium]
MRRPIFLMLIVVCFSLTILPNDPGSIIVTPPAPKFTDAERQAELAKRRASVLEKMSPNSILIMWSATPRNYAGDVDFYYRQENNHYYLTNLKQNGSTLVLVKNGASTSEYLFLPKRNPQAETWNGKMYSNEDATRISGIKTIIDSSELAAFLQTVKDKKAFVSKGGVNISNTAESLYLLVPEAEFDGEGMAEFSKEWNFSKGVTGYKIENARPIFEDLRMVKSPYELKLLQHAIDISTEAHMRSMAMASKASWEYEVQAEVEYTFRRRNADYWGYPSIVGCGPNATTLHYEESQSPVKAGSLLLMDVGAEYEHYTADVTRTFPVNGKFTKEQAEIYQIVYEAQEAAARAIKPGVSMGAPSQAAEQVIKDGLFRLGLITDKNSSQFAIWYMHGWGHWLGMNVHDVGNYGAKFKPGMVMTNEPGIYIREDALNYFPNTPEWTVFKEKVKPAFEKYKNIGVRIEDDMLVTETGTDWMTKKLPRKLEEVEAFIAKSKNEMQNAQFQKMINPTLALNQ